MFSSKCRRRAQYGGKKFKNKFTALNQFYGEFEQWLLPFAFTFFTIKKTNKIKTVKKWLHRCWNNTKSNAFFHISLQNLKKTKPAATSRSFSNFFIHLLRRKKAIGVEKLLQKIDRSPITKSEFMQWCAALETPPRWQSHNNWNDSLRPTASNKTIKCKFMYA